MTDKELQIQKGRKVLEAFFSYSKPYNPKAFTTFENFLNLIQPNKTKQMILMEGIGFGAISANMSDAEINSAMRSMAVQSKGRVPDNNNAFFSYLSNEATQINWVDAIAYTATETAKDVLSGAAQVGDSLLTTGKILNFLLPALLVGGVLIFALSWLNTSTKGDALRMFKGLRK